MIPFVKMESTGNDFIMFKNLDQRLSFTQGEIKKLCHRRLGIGADGLILIDPPTDPKYIFTMRYFNSDGAEVEMCGNGARATMLFSATYTNLKLKNGNALFKTFESECDGTILELREKEAIVSVVMPPIKDVGLINPKESWPHGESLYLHSGVPHLCLHHDNLKEADLLTIGRKYRYDKNFPKGANVNLFQYIENGDVLVRTYERGVEDETLSCGTGAVAVAHCIKQKMKLTTPINIKYPGGYLKVDLSQSLPVLTGPTKVVFEGSLF